jgi:hypothetical protein
MNFADYIAENRDRLEERRQALLSELAEINAEMCAIRTYEKVKQEGPAPDYDEPLPETMSVPEAGKRFLGLSESGSWVALRRGDIPSFKVGRFRRVPVDAMRRKLEERAQHQ